MSAEETDTEQLLADDDWAWKFFKSYTGTQNPWNISAAAKAAGVHRQTPTERRQRDPIFRDLWEQADLIVRDMILAPMIKEAIEGVKRTYTRKDGTVVDKFESDNKLRQWLLERIDPENFHLATKLELANQHDLPKTFKFAMGEKPLQIEGTATEVDEDGDD